MKEHFFQCPYCWEQISMLIDLSIAQQSYVEDCEVCCQPIAISLGVDNQSIVDFDAAID